MSVEACLIKDNLQKVLEEIAKQPEVAESIPPQQLSLPEQIEQIQEYLDYAGEYGVAYEIIVSLLESLPFNLSGLAAIRLLEVALLLRYKTGRSEDIKFDSRID